MHDGQNLFDCATSYSGVDWGIDEALTELMREGLPGAIVVGVWNTGENRWREYMPEKFVRRSLKQRLRALFVSRLRGVPYSDAYLRFLVEEVKPFVDNMYRTLPDRGHTSVMGSSMGGLISLYALEEYPHVFGAAGCVSTHWPAAGDDLVDAMAAALPPPGRHRLYFDYGTETVDAAYEPFQQRMDHHLETAGYTRGVDWLTEKFPGADHSERAWRERVALPLRFLLTPFSL
jgi:predicted alpha/beta superfamily hydrolase